MADQVLETQVADNKVTTPHGGQDWRQCTNFIEDFSVTTNGLGTPQPALEAARAAVDSISHYPPANFEPHLGHTATFLWGEEGPMHKDCLQLGNGASELIDLVIRSCARVGTWRSAPYVAQYEEYKRSAEAAGFTRTDASDRTASLMCLVNPSNPTGDYMPLDEMKDYLVTNCAEDTTVIVDESMHPWVGPHWREDSLASQRDWVRWLSEERKIHVFVMHSWTKIWSCTGIRLGSVIAPTPAHMEKIKCKQVPWSVNCVALEFLSAVVRDETFLARTWEVTPVWRQHVVAELSKYFPDWKCLGQPFLSWVWVDSGDAAIAEKAVQACKKNGVPIRWGKPGYNLPTFFRVAVRDEETTEFLIDTLKETFLGGVRRSHGV
eukprot:CAMPEP_0177706930 /NCGR_PEP_ID=MMETSP0484_2-20121128/9483_1 /TAXON_ID=354590 /ORGANISM="Rhodomonas lens, Strain RHODO" /LENGTH=377 /DNA_ID=CAMNT_0019218415 /DNA_START=43 /DNA_END=1176 /DNA_ORIENTATION=+